MSEMEKNVRTLIMVIKEYIQLQSKLVLSFKEKIGERDWKFLIGFPRHGEIRVDEILWKYLVHGTGVKFITGNVIVDMNRHLEKSSELFDAGRLVEYLESLGEKQVLLNNKIVQVDFTEMSSVLKELCKTGEVRQCEGVTGIMYEIGKYRNR